MATIYFVSCVKSKREKPTEAGDLYTSSWFRKARSIAQKKADRWYILSAKHGLLDPSTRVDPYEQSLKSMTRGECRDWAKDVVDDITEVAEPCDHLVFLAVNDYRRDVVPRLRELGYTNIEEPLDGLRQGEQLSWLKEHEQAEYEPSPPATQAKSEPRLSAPRANRVEHLKQFYGSISRLAAALDGGRVLWPCTGWMDWPERGVYFMMEPGELRGGSRDNRIVRVGTHALIEGSKATLWGRLRQHRGYEDGGGNHRDSILRNHIGLAMCNRDGREPGTEEWANRSSAPKEIREAEAGWEHRVSRYIAPMIVLWVEIGDEPGPGSLRGVIERNSIALLTSAGRDVDPPSEHWLGHHAEAPEIRSSGLWNVNHVGEDYDPRFLDTLGDLIDGMLSGKSG